MGIYLSGPVRLLLPGPYADLGRGGGALAAAGPVPNPRVERGRPALIWADHWSGERLGAFLEKIMSKGAHLP